VSGVLEPAEGLHAIVLAAGASTRFGSAKQLARVGGHPLLHTAVARAAGVAGAAVTVVLGANASELTPLLTHTQSSIVINRDWREGMASSIRAGVARLPPSCTAALLMVVDQAAVTLEDLQRLLGVWRRQPEYIAAAHYGATTGVPAIFPRSSFPELQALRGDVGARQLLRRNPDRVVRVPMQRAAIDIDTPEDLLKLTSER
jgi:molybdenum cofactor cytidylyltransferase